MGREGAHGPRVHLTDMMGDAARWHRAINRALEDWLTRIRSPETQQHETRDGYVVVGGGGGAQQQ